jgi:hypothetical protein
LIGAAILVVIKLIGIIPYIGCVSLPLNLITYVGVGVLAAMYLPPLRTAWRGAGEGALAALIASLIGGITGMIIALARSSVTGAQAMAQLPPGVLDMVRESGISPGFLFGVGGTSIFGSICCLSGILVAVALAAIGGAIYAAAKPE